MQLIFNDIIIKSDLIPYNFISYTPNLCRLLYKKELQYGIYMSDQLYIAFNSEYFIYDELTYQQLNEIQHMKKLNTDTTIIAMNTYDTKHIQKILKVESHYLSFLTITYTDTEYTCDLEIYHNDKRYEVNLTNFYNKINNYKERTDKIIKEFQDIHIHDIFYFLIWHQK